MSSSEGELPFFDPFTFVGAVSIMTMAIAFAFLVVVLIDAKQEFEDMYELQRRLRAKCKEFKNREERGVEIIMSRVYQNKCTMGKLRVKPPDLQTELKKIN